MKRPNLFAFVLPVMFAAVLGWPQMAWADHGQGKGKGNEKKAEKNEKAEKRGGAPVYAVPRDDHRAVVREREVVRVPERYDHRDQWRDHDRYRTVVREYYVRNHYNLPPGLAKREHLPPGLRKQLYERGHLPPGIEKRMIVMPVYIERELPPLPPYYYRAIVDDDVVVIDRRSRVVVSIMPNIFVDLRF